MDKRKHSRLNIHVPAELACGDSHMLRATTANISFGGAYVWPDKTHEIHPGDACRLTLVLQEGADGVTIGIHGVVVHVEKHGIGLRFSGIDADCYQDFKQLMVNHSPDPDRLLEELSQDPGLEVKQA